MGPEHCWSGGWWVFPVVMPIVMLIVMLIVLNLVFGRGGIRPPWWDFGNHTAQGKDSETALEILKKRYARGEISKEEFEQMKKDLLG